MLSLLTDYGLVPLQDFVNNNNTMAQCDNVHARDGTQNKDGFQI